LTDRLWDRLILANFAAFAVPLAVARAQAPAPAPPPVSITLGARHGHVIPQRSGFNHTGGGNIDVAQPSGDTVVVTMTGVVVAGAHPANCSIASMSFDLIQDLEVSIDSPKVKKAKVTIEGRIIGLLRSQRKGDGSATEGPGCASITSEKAEVVTLCVPAHSVSGGENLSINDREGPKEAVIAPGK